MTSGTAGSSAVAQRTEPMCEKTACPDCRLFSKRAGSGSFRRNRAPGFAFPETKAAAVAKIKNKTIIPEHIRLSLWILFMIRLYTVVGMYSRVREFVPIIRRTAIIVGMSFVALRSLVDVLALF